MGFLAEGGLNDWHNISNRLKSHERSKQHIESIASWVELEKRQEMKLTIDASLEEQVYQEKKTLETSFRENYCCCQKT